MSQDDLSLLRLQWPVTVLQNMVWLQNELDAMCTAAKKRFRNPWPGDCLYCGKWIKCDMYRHVSTYHLDLGQLWRCPVSWCTMWNGTSQDCMDHVRGRTMCSRISSRLAWRCPALQRDTIFIGAPLPSVQAGVATLCIPEALSHPIAGVHVASNGLCAM